MQFHSESRDIYVLIHLDVYIFIFIFLIISITRSYSQILKHLQYKYCVKGLQRGCGMNDISPWLWILLTSVVSAKHNVIRILRLPTRIFIQSLQNIKVLERQTEQTH